MAAAPKATDLLAKAATQYASAKASSLVENIGNRASGNGSSNGSSNGDNGEENGGEDKKGLIGNVAEKLGEGASPVGAAVKGLGSSIKEGVKGLFSRKGGSKRPHNIVEDIIVGVPPDVCWAAFTEWEEFPSFMKGPTSVNRGEEKNEEELEEGEHPLEGEETNWTAKIFLSTRKWKATTVDYDEPNRLSWTSEGAKGTVDGTITFSPIGENATLMAVEIEYRSKGPIEWIGQRWHTVGKRVRLDMKHFRRYAMRTEPEELEEKLDNDEGEETEEPQEPTDETPEEETETDEEPEEPTDEEPEEPEEPTDEEPGPEPTPTRRARPARRSRS